MRALVLADSDAYLKWAVSRARDLPSEWQVDVVVLDNAVTPSARQRVVAVAGRWIDVPVVSLAQVAQTLSAGVDVLVLACRGPLIEFFFSEVLEELPERPVVVSGVPGLWFPPTRRGLDSRAAVDVLVVHSERERRMVEAANSSGGPEVALASLVDRFDPEDLREAEGAGAVVFDPQALVPCTRAERQQLLDGLLRTAWEHPSVPVLVKIHSHDDEAQIHHEFASYPELARELRVERPRNLRFVTGPLSAYLGGARGLVTVSSSAAVEAIAAKVPTMVLSDFGVASRNLNEVFQGSGLWGDLDRLARLDFPVPDAPWCEQNYFHDPAASDWVGAVTELVGDPAELRRLRDRRPPGPQPTGLRGRVRRLRLRSQALGAADAPWRRVTTGLVVKPVLAARELVVRAERAPRGGS